jgi:CBS domain containing-hemolysin-like protein
VTEYLVPVIVITVLIAINGFFVAAEFAVAAASRPRVKQLAESGSAAARQVLGVLSSPQRINRYLSTAQVGITLASLGLGMYGEHVVAEWLLHPLERVSWLGVASAHTLASIIAVAALTYLHIVLGEMIPKSIALQSAAQTAVRLSASMAVMDQLFSPLTVVLNGIGNLLLRLMRVPVAAAETRLVSTEELAYIVEESSVGGLLDRAEQVFLENVIGFHERAVHQVMTPRTRIAAIPVTATRAEVLAIVCEEGHSRYPVYDGDRDHILGFLYVKDIARALLEAEVGLDLAGLTRPAVFVPESLPLDEMLDRFRDEHFQIAVVLDEYGGTAGVVSLEDLAEEIVGEIQDEFDEELPPFVVLDVHSLRVRGDLLLDELTQHFDVEFESEEVETVGGLVMSLLGHVAQPGESVEFDGIRYTVESLDGLAIETVLIELPSDHTDSALAPAAGRSSSEDPALGK